MQTIQLKARVGTNGILQVPMPPEVTDVDLDVTVIFQPLATTEPINTATQKETLSQAMERLTGYKH